MSLQRLTWSRLKAGRIPLSLGMCPTDVRLLQWCNEGREQLINRSIGGWWGQTVKVQMCVTDGCITWMREAADIVAVAVCGTPIPIRNSLYPFIENLNHVDNCDSCSCGCQSPGRLELVSDNTTVASSLTVLTTGNTIRFYPADEVDVGKTVLVQGYDQNLIWVRTTVDGVVVDGEQVTLGLPYVDTATQWYRGAPTAIQREATSYRLLMYEHSPTGGGDRLLATYQPDEVAPSYRRSILPGLAAVRGASSTDCSACNTTPLVTAIVKLGYVPIAVDQDWVYPANEVALKYAIRSRKRDEEGDDQGSEADLQRAIRELRRELDGMTGGRTNVHIDATPGANFSQVSAGFW